MASKLNLGHRSANSDLASNSGPWMRQTLTRAGNACLNANTRDGQVQNNFMLEIFMTRRLGMLAGEQSDQVGGDVVFFSIFSS